MNPHGLAELHLHLYGCIRHGDFLQHLETREVDWTRYEDLYEDAFGTRPDIRGILQRHRAGDRRAAAEFERLFIFADEDAGNFRRFLAKFEMLIHGSEWARFSEAAFSLPAATAELTGFAERIADDQQREGIGYAEMRLRPSPAMRGWQIEHVIREVARVYLRRSRAGHTLRLAPSPARENPWPMWDIVQRLLREPEGEVITGIDFCHIEEGHAPKDQAPFFAAVRDHNARNPQRALAVLYHVGESYTDKSLESAVRWVQEAAEMGAARLGHAIALGVNPDAYGPHERKESVAERIDQLAYDLKHSAGLARHGVRVDAAAADAELRRLRAADPRSTVAVRYDTARLHEVRARQDYAMQCVKSTGAVVEVCPASNIRIAGLPDPAHHPVKRFLEAGLRVVVASDDPGILDTRLADEIATAAALAGAGEQTHDEACRALAASAWRYRSECLSGRESAA